jgi:hypothetical protein
MKKNKNLLIAILVILIIAVIVATTIIIYPIFSNPSFESQAKKFCHQTNVNSVEICNNQMIEITSTLLGGGATYHHRDGTIFSCPIISPDTMSANCKAIFNAKQTGQWDCVNVC